MMNSNSEHCASVRGMLTLASTAVNFALFLIMRVVARLSRRLGRRVLVVRSDGIGDCVLFGECLKRLVELFAPAEVDVALPQHCAALAATCPGVQRVIGWNPRRFRRNPFYRIALASSLARRGYCTVINPQFTHEQYGDHLACSLGVARTIGFDIPQDAPARIRLMRRSYTETVSSAGDVRCELERGAELLNAMGVPVPTSGLRPRVFLTEEDRVEARQLLPHAGNTRRLICLMPGCQQPIRVWPWKRYLLVARKLRERYAGKLSFVVLGADKDQAVAESLVRELGRRSHNLAGRTSIRVLAAVIEMCDLFIGVETGAAHMALAVDTSAVVILGGGHYGRFFPYEGRMRAVSKPLPCFGCDWTCTREQPDCILNINAEDVTQAAFDLIEECGICNDGSRPSRISG